MTEEETKKKGWKWIPDVHNLDKFSWKHDWFYVLVLISWIYLIIRYIVWTFIFP